MSEHPDLQGVGGAMREEWRAEQEAATADAAADYFRRRTMQEHLRELMHRGDRLAVTVAGFRMAGVPEEVGNDLLAIRALFGRVDIQLSPFVPLWFEPVERATAGGDRGTEVAGGSFYRALQMREQENLCTIGTVFDPDGFDGRLSVASDFVIIYGMAGAQVTVPIAQVAWVSGLRN